MAKRRRVLAKVLLNLSLIVGLFAAVLQQKSDYIDQKRAVVIGLGVLAIINLAVFFRPGDPDYDPDAEDVERSGLWVWVLCAFTMLALWILGYYLGH